MPLFDGSTVSAGLSKPPSMSGVVGKPTLSYNAGYVMFDPRGRDGEGFPPHWTNSKAALAQGKTPVGHLPGAVGQNHMRPNFAFYAHPSEVSSPTASADGRRQKPGCENSSPSSENSVYFARPQPVYRAAPCCNGPGCVVGPPYGVEHGSRMLSSLYERDWLQSGAPYSKRPPVQRQGPDALLEQRCGPFEPAVDSLNRIHVDPYGANRVKTLPVIMQPTFPRYHCAPTLSAPLSEPLQTAPRGYPGLYSHRTYEQMTSELYQDPSSLTKYGPLAHHPVFYCPPPSADAEQRTQCKETSKKAEDVPAIHKHSLPNSLEHCIVTQSLHGDIPLAFPSADMLPVHPFMQGFSYPCYAVPRVHSNANQIRSPVKSPHALPIYNYSLLNVSPSRPHKDHPRTSPTSPSRDTSGLSVGQVSAHSPFMYVNQSSPARRPGQPGASPSGVHMASLFPTLAGLTVSPAAPSPVGMNFNRLADYLPHPAPETCPRRAQSLPHSPSAWLSHTHQAHATPEGPKAPNVTYSPPTESKRNSSASFSGSPAHRDHLKRKHSSLTPPIKIKEEDVSEGVIRKKLKKLNYQPAGGHVESPPMPVIDNVFSLASYLNTSRASFSSEASIRTRTPSPDECDGETKKQKLDPDDQRSDCAVSAKEICPNVPTPTEKAARGHLEHIQVKIEKVDPSETDPVEEAGINQSECIKVIIKGEPEDAGPPVGNPTKLCKSERLESETPSEMNTDVSVESEPDACATNQNPRPRDDVHRLHKAPAPSQDHHPPPPQPEPAKPSQKNPSNSSSNQNTLSRVRPPWPRALDQLPAQALTLALPLPVPVPVPVPVPGPVPVPLPGPVRELVPKLSVRKHFFAMHYSFCKLVSELVSASSEQELKTWLSLQEIGPVSSSTKVQKVTCLLGVKARDVWIKEGMKSMLGDILQRLKEYTEVERCPFLHIMRTGAVFLPMLVVKELLFPMVQGSLVDKVLQEHKVELRPTTLSEEKILIQLHKKACSSKLRRLMSLRHLPDVYADVVNVLYYTSVCKRLGVDHRDPDGDDAASENWTSVVSSDASSAASTSDFQPAPSDVKEQDAQPRANRSRTKSRVKSSSRRTFLDCGLSDEGEAGDCGKRTDVAQRESSLVLQNKAAEKSWTCPLSGSDVEEKVDRARRAESSSEPSRTVRTKAHSGVILRLRRMLGGLNRKSDCYQSVPVSGTFSDSALFHTDDDDDDDDDDEGTIDKPKTTTVTQCWQKVANFSHTLKSLKRKRRAVLQVKGRPYRASHRGGGQRRRRVLRSAVQRAHVALRLYYPDLVGKRIRHLYEEDDKSEVWYRGEVLRVHEANANPLKTIFEVQYDSEPEWKYYLELLMDYEKGWLKVDD